MQTTEKKYPVAMEALRFLSKEEIIIWILHWDIIEMELNDNTPDKNWVDITTLSAYRQDGSYNIYVSGKVNWVYTTQALEFMEIEYEEASNIISEFLSTNNFLKLHHN